VAGISACFILEANFYSIWICLKETTRGISAWQLVLDTGIRAIDLREETHSTVTRR